MRSTVLWTGGKDSAMAFYKACLAGHEIVNLLTFVPKEVDFLAHPIPFMKDQAKAIGIPHYEAELDAPLEESYEKSIRSFRERYKIGAFITGDIAEVEGQPNWIRQRCKDRNVEVLTPLWGADRYQALSKFISCGFKAIISCIKIGCLTEEWLGRELDEKSLDCLADLSNKTGIDICGENGEYHTLVFDGPIFNKRVIIGGYSKHKNDSVMYIKTL
jgi:diphthine-ammonia ligase